MHFYARVTFYDLPLVTMVKIEFHDLDEYSLLLLVG